MRRLGPSLLLAVAACAGGGRREPTPPLAGEAPAAAALEAARQDPQAGAALSPDEQVDHALSRLSFGARPGDRERVRKQGVAAYIEEQLHPDQLPDSALQARLEALPILKQSSSDLAHEMEQRKRERQERKKRNDDEARAADEKAKANGPITAAESARISALESGNDGYGRRPIEELADVKLLRAVLSERQLQEVMSDFWFNHFNVFAGKDHEQALIAAYERDAIAKNALGKFGDLVRGTAHSPAMLIYLDNWRSSSKEPPPEPRRMKRTQFARRGPFGAQGPQGPQTSGAPQPPRRPNNGRGLNENYARELLELHTLGVDGGYTQHDVTEVARCFTGWTVAEPNEDPRFIFRRGMHDMGEKHVLGHTIAAGREQEDGEEVLDLLLHHPATARFISRKLVRRFVSDEPPEALVTRAAATFTRTDGDIRSVLRTIFESPEFWSRRALRAKVRSPLELVAGSVRALGGDVTRSTALARAVARIGEPLYGAQPPTGYGDTAQTWVTSGALLARIDFGLQLAAGQLDGVRVDLLPLAQGTTDPATVLERAERQLCQGGVSAKTRGFVLDQLRQGPQKPQLLAARAVGLLLGAPELQRR